MTADPVNLLKRLEPPVRSGAHALPKAPLESMRFGELLALASSGTISSGREVMVAFALSPALEPAQLERIAAAADLAESAGARIAAMLVDGRALVMNVPDRAITGELSMTEPLRSVDAAVYVAEAVQVERPLVPGAGLPWSRIGSEGRGAGETRGGASG